MSWAELVDRLAGVAGLEPWYYDIAGVKHETTVESKVLVLSAFGADAPTFVRVIPVDGPTPFQLALAPLGDTWEVIGVMQE